MFQKHHKTQVYAHYILADSCCSTGDQSYRVLGRCLYERKSASSIMVTCNCCGLLMLFAETCRVQPLRGKKNEKFNVSIETKQLILKLTSQSKFAVIQGRNFKLNLQNCLSSTRRKFITILAEPNVALLKIRHER